MIVGTWPVPIMVGGAALYVPETTLTSVELEGKFGLERGLFARKTGVESRRVAGQNETTEDLAVPAAERALQDARVRPGDIDLAVVGTFTPSTHLPGIASAIAYRLGLWNCSATIDVNTACTSGVMALIQAANHLAISDAQYAIVIASDTATKSVDWADPGGVTPLLGDAAAAVVLAKGGKGIPIRAYACGADPKLYDAIQLGVGEKNFIRMRGRDVFNFAAREVPLFVRGMLARAEMSVDDVDLFIMHQANGRIIEAVQENLKIPSSRVFSNIYQYGNTSSAATLVPFADALEQGFIEPDKTTALVSFGAGMTLCTVVLGP